MKKLLPEIAEIRAGYQFRGRIPVYESGTVGVIQGKDVRVDHTLDPTEIVRVADDGGYERFFVQLGDVMVMNRGSHNYATLIDAPLPRTVTLGSFTTLRPNLALVQPRYLLWALNEPRVQGALASRARGSSIPNLSISALQDFALSVPPLAEQAVIVELAGSLDMEEKLTADLFAVRRQALSLRVFGVTAGAKTRIAGSDSDNPGMIPAIKG